MNAIDILNKIKSLAFSESQVEQPVAMELKEYSLADGTKVMIDKLEVGGMAKIGEAPAPAGQHVLADGTQITVDEAGMIVSVLPKSEEPEEDEMMKKLAPKFSEIEQRFSEQMQTKFQAFESQIKTLNEANGHLQTGFQKQAETIQGLIQLCETLVKEPNTEPAKPKSGIQQFNEAKAEKLQRLFENFKQK